MAVGVCEDFSRFSFSHILLNQIFIANFVQCFKILNKMKEQYNIEQLGSLVSNLNTDKRYWFFRSMGGTFFEEFVEDGFIAIGSDDILLKDLKQLPLPENQARTNLKVVMREKYYDISKTQLAKAVGQIIKFYRNLTIGDVIVVPNFQSKKYAIGIVKSEMYEDCSKHEEGKCQFAKRRKVKWLHTIERYQFDPKFLLCLGNQQTMSCLDDYADFIDRKIEPLYTKGDNTYLVLRVNQDKGLSWDDFCLFSDLGELFKAVSRDNGINADLTKIRMTVNVQSPGDIMMVCPEGMKYLLIIVVVAICGVIGMGGRVKFWKFEFESRGLGFLFQQIMDSVTKYLDHQTDRKLRMQERLANMRIEQVTEDSVPETNASDEIRDVKDNI